MKPEPHFSEFQSRVIPWIVEAFGLQKANNVEERTFRFVEETLELAQACGVTEDQINDLIEYTYGRPPGEHVQEIGGVMVTLASLAGALGHNMHVAAETELSRCWQNIDVIREKDANKIKGSSLPGQTIQQRLDALDKAILAAGRRAQLLNEEIRRSKKPQFPEGDINNHRESFNWANEYHFSQTGKNIDALITHGEIGDELIIDNHGDIVSKIPVIDVKTNGQKKPFDNIEVGNYTNQIAHSVLQKYENITDTYLIFITGIHDMQFPRNKDEKRLCDLLLPLNRRTVAKHNLEAFKDSLLWLCNQIPNTAVNWLPTYDTDQNNDHVLSLGEGRKFTFKLLQIGSR